MIKKRITYTDFNGEERTEDFYFNLTKAELAEMENSVDGGFSAYLQKIKDAQNLPELFKDLILRSYGEKSADGRRFIKKRNGENLSDIFESTEAYSVLFMELAQNADAAAEFVNGVVPQIDQPVAPVK